MSISLQSGDRGLKRWLYLKYNVLKRENRLSLGLNVAKNTNYMKEAWSKSCWEFNSLQKSKWTHVSISHQRGARGFERLLCLKYKNVLKRRCQKYRLYEKKSEVKVVENSIPYKKLSRHTCLSPHRMELGGSKDCRI